MRSFIVSDNLVSPFMGGNFFDVSVCRIVFSLAHRRISRVIRTGVKKMLIRLFLWYTGLICICKNTKLFCLGSDGLIPK
jgi:hypothetical protein